MTESIGTFMRVSLMTGFVLAFPYILFEVLAFMNPGLKKSERRLVLFAIPFSFLLFVAGITFTYFVILPTALPFLLNFMGVTTVPRPSNYIHFVTSLMFWIGLAFQFPLVIYVLAGLGFVDARTLSHNWRFALVGIAVLAAAATPTIDPINMGLVMAPMIVPVPGQYRVGRNGRRRQTKTRRGARLSLPIHSPVPRIHLAALVVGLHRHAHIECGAGVDKLGHLVEWC